MLLLVIPTMTYSEMVLGMVGSKIIDKAMDIISKGELAKVTITSRQGHFGAVMSGSLQLPCTSSNATRVEKEVIHSSPRDGPVDVREFCLDDVRGPVCTTQKVTIPTFSTISVHTNSSIKGHCMWVHMLTELMPGPQLPTDSDLWRTASGVLKGTYLSVQLRCPFLRNPHKDCGWVGYPCQPGATSGHPNKDFQGTQ